MMCKTLELINKPNINQSMLHIYIASLARVVLLWLGVF